MGCSRPLEDFARPLDVLMTRRQRFAQTLKGFLRQWQRLRSASAEQQKVREIGPGISGQMMSGAEGFVQQFQGFSEKRFRLRVPAGGLHVYGEVAQAHRDIRMPGAIGFFPQF